MGEPSILHVDMDAFYASVEVIKDPSLRGKPVVVGGQGGRGVVTSASYEARVFGIRSAMPSVTARRLCPQAIFLQNDFDTYVEYSRKIREVFLSYTPLVESLSLDEAFLDVSGSTKLFGAPTRIGERIRIDIASLGLPCTVGIAPNKFLAKLASTQAKPAGFKVIEENAIEGFLHPLPVGALWGVGPATAEVLRRLGLRTVGDLAAIERRTLERAVGDGLGAHLYALARGLDDRAVVAEEPARSVGAENTFEHDLDSRDDILREILRLSDRVAGRLRSKSLCGRTVTLKVRFSNFKTITRSRTVDEIDTGAEIYDVARSLYIKLDPDRPRIRLLGVSISGLAPGPPRRQMSLEGSRDSERSAEAARAIDAIRERFGRDAVGPATLLDS